ncbi:MAG: glutamate racemase [Gemmatimonadota bacterium]
MTEAPIGVFDSGLGGLTVLRAIRDRLPGESTVYLGDTARVPYGPKSAATIRRYALEATTFLRSHGVKGIVVACNTATARALPTIAREAGVPVLGVVEPGARAAANRSRSGRIGVIGTTGTIESGAYVEAIHAIRPDAEVAGVACPLFVPLVEEGWIDGDVAERTTESYLRPLLAKEIDTLVLACTHYPLLRPLLARIVGPETELIDSADATAEALAELLERHGMAAAEGGDRTARYFVTDEEARFGRLARQFMGEDVAPLETVSVDSTA